MSRGEGRARLWGVGCSAARARSTSFRLPSPPRRQPLRKTRLPFATRPGVYNPHQRRTERMGSSAKTLPVKPVAAIGPRRRYGNIGPPRLARASLNREFASDEAV